MQWTGTACLRHRADPAAGCAEPAPTQTLPCASLGLPNELGGTRQVHWCQGLILLRVFPLSHHSWLWDGPRCFPSQVRSQRSAGLPACKAQPQPLPGPRARVSAQTPRLKGVGRCGCSSSCWRREPAQGPPAQAVGAYSGSPCQHHFPEMPALPQAQSWQEDGQQPGLAPGHRGQAP